MRSSGILLHISSLPSPYGIGTMGKESYAFVDFLKDAGQRYWQILPLNPPGYGNSPYASFCAFAGNWQLIDLNLLAEDGLLSQEELLAIESPTDPGKVDFELILSAKPLLLRQAVDRFERSMPPEFYAFCEQHHKWLDDFAFFMALKNRHGGAPFWEWEEPLFRREPSAMSRAKSELMADILYHKVLQYLFFTQWQALKRYANERGVFIIGDLPIYLAQDSVEVWAHPQLFELDEFLCPIEVSGCPPDGFSPDGQLWGNPLYDWERMRENNYRWWQKRMSAALDWYDVVRIDHFRGFASFYAIPAGEKTARVGRWRKGPGKQLFDALTNALGELPLIAEDLGFVTDEVRALLADTGYPGMKVLQFAFDSREDSDYLPHNYPRHCVAYTGTHDNDTLAGWLCSAPQTDVQFAKDYLRLNESEGEVLGMVKALLSSVADLTILPMQDWLSLGSAARMNTPATVGDNWHWRLQRQQCTNSLSREIYRYTALYRRLPEE